MRGPFFGMLTQLYVSAESTHIKNIVNNYSFLVFAALSEPIDM